MRIGRLKDGSLVVPRRAEADGVVGDGSETVRPGTREHQAWTAWLERSGEEPEDAGASEEE